MALNPTPGDPVILPAPAPGLNQAQVAQALNDHGHIKRSTDIPFFWGRKEKDTIAACLLIERVNDAATIARWAIDHKT
jgi:hypothetical protein